MKTKHQIVVLEDNPKDVALIEGELRKAGFDFAARHTRTEPEFVAAITEIPPSLVIADFSLPRYDGMQALTLFRSRHPEVPFIFVSGTIGEEKAVELIKRGATDYVPKTDLVKLGSRVERALREAGEQQEKRRAELARTNSEGRFRALFEGAGAGIAIEDLQGKIIETNRALQQMLGYDASELQSMTRREFTHSQDLKEETAHFKRLLAENPITTGWRSGLFGATDEFSGDG